MRVLVVDTYYPAFTAAHYAERPGLEEASYDEQLASLMDRCFGTADAYSTNLIRLGHEAQEVIPNCEPLQLAWAREHRVVGAGSLAALAGRAPHPLGPAARQALLHRILGAQIRAANPNVVYVQDLWFLGRQELNRLRRRKRLVVGQIASEPPEPERLQGFDLIVTSFPHYVERFRALGVGSEYFPIAFNRPVLDRIELADRPHGAVFVGGVNPRVHPAGTALLERLAARGLVDVWGYGADELASDSPILARHHGEAWGIDMYRVLARSRIVVNRHIEAAEGFANNMRLYESTGMGALLLTEAAPNLDAIFAPGREVATYTSEDELVERIEHFLAHEDERAAIARAGHERTLAEHTYERRIPELAQMLEERLR